MADVFRFFPEYSKNFITFVSVDPGRNPEAQIKALVALEREYPVYGIKIVPIACQSKVTELLDRGRDLLDYARERDLPILFHSAVSEGEEYSQAADEFRVIEQNPDLRYCLAHCIGCHKGFLDRAAQAPNVWVDTAAMKIQIQLVYDDSPVMAQPSDRVDADYSDHRKVMRTLVEAYPDTILWGTDSPYYSYACRRQQGEGVFEDFQLKATYADEKAGLDALPKPLRKKACNTNTLRFLFGDSDM
jgi:predicted TIM-barrel fold metal-dependent hydrolase